MSLPFLFWWSLNFLKALDDGIRTVVEALKTAGLYDNSVIVFSTDNGGSINKISNYPLKGRKEQLYEGGVRGIGFVHSPFLEGNRKYDG